MSDNSAVPTLFVSHGAPADPTIEITADQTTAITHTVARCLDGWIEHGWEVNTDDPPGEYLVTVEIDGYATQRYRVDFF